jgi:hypothetical protein
MADHESTWRRITAMARTRYPEDLETAHLHTMVALEADQTVANAREDELYGHYREGMGEAAPRMAVTLEGERASLESLQRQPPSETTAVIQAANARLSEARSHL